MRKYIVLGKLLLFAVVVLLLAWAIVAVICYNTSMIGMFDEFLFKIVVVEVGFGMALLTILVVGVVGFLVKRRRGNRDERWAFFCFTIFGGALSCAYGWILWN